MRNTQNIKTNTRMSDCKQSEKTENDLFLDDNWLNKKNWS